MILIVVAFDSNNNLVKRWEVPGYRYPKDIEIDTQNKKITFIMEQSNYGVGSFPVDFDWDELQID
ncbi:hypothetical protein [Brevibacillus daliensis]|uniref:hypothetical protein n=1 Tax=Brevibacillus daliensis TaxID=2892995 RepID=UPI001E42726C|nr:hypothetical protein [Brevibacillus daliensis]